MSAFLNPGYTTYNTVAASYSPSSNNDGFVAGSGKIGDALFQINQGGSKGDTVNFSSKAIGAHYIVAADSNDTVNLQDGNWTNAGTVTDSTTGITGTEYKSGDQEVLVSGTSNVTGVSGSTTSGGTNSAPLTDPKPTLDAIKADINTIDGGKGSDAPITKAQIQAAVDGAKVGADLGFWQNILNNFASVDNDKYGKSINANAVPNFGAGDGVITINDIQANTPVTSSK